MSTVVWDQPGDRVYETGVDRGVLYTQDGSVVPWNGLTSVSEKIDNETTSVYFDGMKINDLVTLGDFLGTIKAITYPDELDEIEGLGQIASGLFLGGQSPQTFGLSYRTMIGNDLGNEPIGYKIHIIYNVSAIPNDKEHVTMSDQVDPTEFQWEIRAVPEEIPGFRPTAHVIIDSRNIAPEVLEELEGMLYGTDIVVASLIPITYLLNFLNTGLKWKIIETDGLWSATTSFEDLIELDLVDIGLFTLYETNAVFLTADTYEISDEYLPGYGP